MKSNLITLVTAAILLAAIPGASSQCYLPDGHLADDYGFNFEPCNGRNTTWQQCCFPGDICTGNGICMHSGGTVADTFSYRGGCMNADWSGCPHACLELTRCDTRQYCCYSHFLDDCCDGESYQFSLSNYNPSAKYKTDGTESVTIGAAVGGGLGGLATLGAVGVWMYLRKKRVHAEKEATAQDEISDPPETKQVLEMGADSVGGQKCISEADMKDDPRVVEMDSTVVYELGA
ncbi:hypothetical protein MKX08_005085 [Trichoderma sp. CBMAI-0020]|nr:hypothetical protein MKX08_005085 [Trichoderma sp. CBMAI-0020]